MKKKSNRYLKYCLRYEEYKFPSSCSYKFLVTIVYATGIMDVIGSCLLIYGCSLMLDVLVDMEQFNQMFPTLIPEYAKMFGDITGRLIGLDKDEGLNVKFYKDILVYTIITFKVSSVLLLGVALFFLVLSLVLFYGIYKRNSTCCFIWNVCLCMTMIIYFVLALVVSVFNLFTLRTQDWIMVYAYGFYRLGTLVAVYRFQQKFLFFSKVNGHTSWYAHKD